MSASLVTVSLVIPAYNEEDHLRACLGVVARQTIRPFEVIVVDNNSTDNTVAVAHSFPFVRVIHEARQGVVFARDAGFDAARGEIIGRIDADSRLGLDWVAKVQEIFAQTNIGAVSGSIRFYDAPFPSLFGWVDLLVRRTIARPLTRRREMFLAGGNMAIRRSLWLEVRSDLCREAAQHEDMDLAAHIAHSRHNIDFCKDLIVAISARRIDDSFRALYTYAYANSRTYLNHGLKGRFYMYPIAWLVLVFVPFLRLLYRSYDPTSRRFSLNKLFRQSSKSRINPISEVT